MIGKTDSNRAVLAVSLSAALALLLVGCADAGGRTPETAETAGISSAPGRVGVRIAGIDLTVTDAVVHIGPEGGTLTMSVRNNSTVPEHLGMVATPTGGRGVLIGAEGAEGTGSLTTAGILLQPGTTATFGGGDGPAVELPAARDAAGRSLLPVTLQFGVAGLVHLEARVSAR
ncbi:hypothetical protein QMA61_29555 [Streptomyces coelicoflavus]|uniref:hypothetical protein n=1 Tax=Streptomyces TaxID=1883 RepID=UPI0024AD8574|nr:hypothetical protein [Streptomyces coelicoflavus]MDI6520329.1 hypothetical protein [Streptomyces coelicoflavus]